VTVFWGVATFLRAFFRVLVAGEVERFLVVVFFFVFF
jgi:hypothetical protein